MLLIRYQTSHNPNYGIVEDGEVYAALGDPFHGMLTRGDRVGPLEQSPLLAPVQPGKIVAVGRNYAAHAAEHGAEVPTEPLLFLKAPSSVIGPGAPIIMPALSQRVDYEAELAIVIGERCRAVAERDAWDVILGVTCANDVTARDLQFSDGQWARAKSFDTFCPLGPAIITRLAPAEIERLEVVGSVNGAIRQRGNVAELVFGIPRLIAAITAVMTLEPGDVILTGTPAGVGPLQDGDTVTVTIEGVGVLQNPVQQEVGTPRAALG